MDHPVQAPSCPFSELCQKAGPEAQQFLLHALAGGLCAPVRSLYMVSTDMDTREIGLLLGATFGAIAPYLVPTVGR